MDDSLVCCASFFARALNVSAKARPIRTGPPHALFRKPKQSHGFGDGVELVSTSSRLSRSTHRFELFHRCSDATSESARCEVRDRPSAAGVRSPSIAQPEQEE